MRIGWLANDPGYTGGAELTAAEFWAAAPDDIEILDCPAGGVVEADIYVCQNIPHHSLEDLHATRGKPLVKYVHDAWSLTKPGVREWVLDNAKLIFCSQLHLERFPYPVPEDAEVIPPPVDLDSFRPSRQAKRNTDREGVCSIAQWRNAGKGLQALLEWAAENEEVDVYGAGDFTPVGKNLNYRGPLEPYAVAQTLWGYETFVFLPFDFEPFCRTVIEAHAAGCRVVTNRLVGAVEYMDNSRALETASKDFWDVVLG